MSVVISVTSGVLLAIILWQVWKNTWLPDLDMPCDAEENEQDWAPCPWEFVSNMFSRNDWEFVSKFNSQPLITLFMRERKLLARAWVRATASSIHRILREHLRIARRSSDLEISAEVRIFIRYGALQVACAFLLLSIGLVGPVRLRDLSLYVYRLSERLSYAHWALKAATETKKLQGVWHA